MYRLYPTRASLLIIHFLNSTSGSVLAARRPITNLTVAIKLVDLDERPKKDLVLNEILSMKALRHPNIIKYIDSYLYQNRLWLVMEYMEGGSLTDLVTTYSMTVGQIAAVSRETCMGIKYLHQRGIIHRDIKSENVLFSSRGRVKLSALIIQVRYGHTDSIQRVSGPVPRSQRVRRGCQ